jgi:AcrR family transcriptional regulator
MSNPIETTKDRIRAEAQRLFVERGVDAVSVRAIARAVGMSAANLYAHYKSRDELVADLFAKGLAEYGRRLGEAAQVPGDVRVRVEAMVRLICLLHDEDETRFRFLLLTQHRNLSGIDRRADSNPVEVVQRTISAAMQAGEIRTGDPALLAAAIVGIVIQAATFHVYGRIDRRLGEMSDEIVALCLRVLP